MPAALLEPPAKTSLSLTPKARKQLAVLSALHEGNRSAVVQRAIDLLYRTLREEA